MHTPHVVELHVRTLEPTSLDTFRPVEHLPNDVDLLVVMPDHKGDIENDSHRRLL